MAGRTAPLAVATLALLATANIVCLSQFLASPAEEDPVANGNPELTAALPPSDTPVPETTLAPADQIVARPVFFRTREPFVPRPAAAPPPKPVAPPPVFVDPGFVLGGVMITAQARKAFILRNDDRNGAWISQGDSIAGWQVKSVEVGGTRLQKDDRTIELRLYAER